MITPVEHRCCRYVVTIWCIYVVALLFRYCRVLPVVDSYCPTRVILPPCWVVFVELRLRYVVVYVVTFIAVTRYVTLPCVWVCSPLLRARYVADVVAVADLPLHLLFVHCYRYVGLPFGYVVWLLGVHCSRC